MASPKTQYFSLYIMSTLHPSLVDAINLSSMGAYHNPTSSLLTSVLGYGKNRKLCDIAFSNLGATGIQTEYSDFHISELIFVPPNTSYTKKVYGFITTNGNLKIGKREFKK